MTRTFCFFLMAAAAVTVTFLLAGCQSAQGSSPAEKRAYALDMRDDVLRELYAKRPEARSKVTNAAGYGAFTNIGSKIFVLSTGNGYGVVHDNRTGDNTYMKMIEVGGGLGIGVRQYSAVFIFNNANAMRRFVNSGWEFGGDAEATAKAGDTGGAADAQGTTGQLDGLEVYLMTKNGISLSATVAGTKYYKDSELNRN